MTGLEIIPIMVSSLATTTIAANLLYIGTYAALVGGLAIGASALSAAFMPKPSVPKPEDGKYNLKQSVPPLTYVLGRVKKASDYVFLEESSGVAYHILVWAGHRIEGYVTHYLHDEVIGVDSGGYVTSPAHFSRNGTLFVNLQSRLGLDAETAYSLVVSNFPSIWTTSHRGDGLASVLLSCSTVAQKYFLDVYPNQMPEHSAVGDGMRIYDPRTSSTAFSNNLALFRFWHLTSAVGGKLSISDMYLPEWQNAANVCDESVTNRTGGTESRYHGGLWFRSNSDPVEIGRLIDQAAELVVYERPDGLVGVHAGEYVTPTVRLTETDIISANLDVNTRRAGTVLAVRGRFTDPSDGYTTNDSAIYGDPYGDVDDSTERTFTLDNQAVQSHNHIQRLQKITYTRKNAKRVSIVAHYEAAKDVLSSRFVKVHLPPKMSESVVEITSTPRLSLRDLTISFAGIIIPDTLYDFNAATEEGEPGSTVTPLTGTGVPTPTGFSATVQTEVIAGGGTAAYIFGEWTHISDALTYEMEYERTDLTSAPISVYSAETENNVRSGYLADGEEYRVRLRAWGGGTSSEFTSYTTITATADPVAPAVVTEVSVDVSVSGQASFTWTAPNSANYYAARIYINTVDTFGTATLSATEYGPPSSVDLRAVTGLTAGSYYGWIVAINASGVAATAVATGSFTVT